MPLSKNRGKNKNRKHKLVAKIKTLEINIKKKQLCNFTCMWKSTLLKKK